MLLLRDPAKEFWTQYLKASRTLYVQYNQVGLDSSDVVDEINANLSSHDVAKIVLDLRNNGGGEARGLQQLLDFLAEPGRDLPRRLYVLIGRLTFSAAAIFVVQIEQEVPGAIFVGEATGGAPNFWADVDTVTLPNSGLKALISTTYEGYSTPNDHRLAIEPDMPVDLTSADYFSGRDPVLEAALAAP
jgi:C-terminal processing protease CtpA/Prc